MATQHSPGPSYTGLPSNFHPMVRPGISLSRSAGLQACCGTHGCLHYQVRCHVQRACSIKGMDGFPTALAHQLPRVFHSAPDLEPSQRAFMRQAHAGPHRQHCDHCVHQLSRWSALPSHVRTPPPPPPLESEAFEVALCHSHPRSTQPGSQ